jgi:hypothetical protein
MDSMKPFQVSSPASVTTNAGTRVLAKEKPLDGGKPFGHAVVHVQNGEDGRRETADRADRQVEFTDQQHEDDADRDESGARDVHAEVGQVPGREEALVQGLEGDPDRGEDEEDGQ